MKYISLTLSLLAVFAGQAFGQIGYTLDQCRREYGKEVKSGVAWTGGDQRAYGFVHDGLYIYVILSGGKVVDITYFNDLAKTELSPKLKNALWYGNVSRHLVWDDTFYQTTVRDWNGKRTFRKLGKEPGVHYVMFETNGVNGLVENSAKLGYQIRTLSQFELEQKHIN